MVRVIVEHFLNNKGQEYFPQWIGEIKTYLKNYEGFVSIEQLIDIKNETRTVLLLSFKSLETLMSWAKSQTHDNEIKKLDAFMVQKQISHIFESRD